MRPCRPPTLACRPRQSQIISSAQHRIQASHRLHNSLQLPFRAMTAPQPLPPLELSVKCRGLPFKATTEDILKFFQGFALRPDCIYLKRHPDGRPNGEAFIVFDTHDEARRATSKDRETFGQDKFGDRYVRVYPTLESDTSDMQQAVMQQAMGHHQVGTHGHGHSDSVVKIKSLPFDANQLDIIQFFEGFRLKPNGVQLVVRSDNKPTGEAFVDFESAEEAGRAIRDKDHKVFNEKFGERFVRLIQVSRKEMQATLALRFGGEGILKMKGIPFKASAADVRKFFSARASLKPDGVSFIMHADGRPTGMAFIEFETPQEAVRAMEKDRAKFGPEYGDRFCMLQLVGRHEMEKVALQRESDMPPTNKQLLAVALAQATQALQNQALMNGNNAWLGGLNPLHLGLVANSSLSSLSGQMSSLSSGMSSHTSSAGNASMSCNAMLDAQLAAQLSSLDTSGANPLLFYQNGDWARNAANEARDLAAAGLGAWTAEQLAAAQRCQGRTIGYAGGPGL